MIVVIGCGFLGSLYVEEVCKRLYAGERTIGLRLIDSDRWEPRNAANQNVRVEEAMMNGYKAVSMAEVARRYRQHDEAITDRFTFDATGLAMLENAALIVDAVDNLETRQNIWRAAVGFGIPTVHLGLSLTGAGLVQWTAPDHDTFSLSPIRTAGSLIADPPSGMEPPCKLAGMRSAGWHTAFAGAIATSIFFGFDPEGYIADRIKVTAPFIPKGWMTDWRTTPESFTPLTEMWKCLEQL